MSIPLRRSIQIVIVLRCEVADMGVYGKRRYIEGRIGGCVGVLRGELYGNSIFLPCLKVDRPGRSEDRSIKENFQRLCHP